MFIYIRKCILIFIVLRNVIEFLLSVGIGGVVLSVGFVVRVMIVVVWKGGEFVFMWCLRRLSLVGFIGFSFILCFCVIVFICCFDIIYKGMNLKVVLYE